MIYYPVLFCDNFVGINFNPNYYVDISEFFTKKIAISSHKSQKLHKYIELLKSERFRSVQCNDPKITVRHVKFVPSFPF